jgi:nucleoid DNA-binding protein
MPSPIKENISQFLDITELLTTEEEYNVWRKIQFQIEFTLVNGGMVRIPGIGTFFLKLRKKVKSAEKFPKFIVYTDVGLKRGSIRIIMV